MVISEKWMHELDAMPFISREKGRMSALLKTKSKVQSERKDRITYTPFDFEKKIKGPVEEVKQNADGQNDG